MLSRRKVLQDKYLWDQLQNLSVYKSSSYRKKNTKFNNMISFILFMKTVTLVENCIDNDVRNNSKCLGI